MINEVRNTVLAIMNKDNNGYMTPEEFNLFSRQAQLEVFEEYFYDFNAWVNKQNSRKSNSGYTDIPKQLEQVIDLFSKVESISYAQVQINVTGVLGGAPGTTFSVGDTVTQAVSGATGTVTHYETSSAVKVLRLDGTTGTFNNTGLITGSSGATLAAPMSAITVNNFYLPDDWYFINQVIYNSSAVADRVHQDKIIQLVNSNLTAPTSTYPAYTMNGATANVPGNTITVYPATIVSAMSSHYVRYPKDPKWTYNTVGGSPIFNSSASDYQDFEMPYSDQTTLVYKILQQAGVNIREASVVQFATQEELVENQEES